MEISAKSTPSMQQTERISIRTMQPEDLEQVLAIDRVSFSMPWPASAYKYELNENPLSLLWVAETNPLIGEGQIVGMIVVWLIVDEAHIATIAVRPEYRGQGIARSLLTTALRTTLRQGYHKATLEVRANNIAAQRLYRSFGFEIVGHRPRYYRDNNEDAIIMTASKLNPAQLEDSA
ncbi:MAG: ribosomal protein S18-alanine N-acetyltransferase [Anaerolineales bacterium]|nr:ribosomal protein S18-alanine N-acetyltransferase [Anaerolineales bacterium]